MIELGCPTRRPASATGATRSAAVPEGVAETLASPAARSGARRAGPRRGGAGRARRAAAARRARARRVLGAEVLTRSRAGRPSAAGRRWPCRRDAPELELLERRCRTRASSPPQAPATGAPACARCSPGRAAPARRSRRALLAAALGKDALPRRPVDASSTSTSARPRRTSTRVFARAEELDVVLLLDEGDALLTRRTDVRTPTTATRTSRRTTCSQRLESFEGILVVTTNAGERIDGAFRRRIDVVVEFRAPDAAERWAHLAAAPARRPRRRRGAARRGRRALRAAPAARSATRSLHAALLALDDGGAVGDARGRGRGAARVPQGGRRLPAAQSARPCLSRRAARRPTAPALAPPQAAPAAGLGAASRRRPAALPGPGEPLPSRSPGRSRTPSASTSAACASTARRARAAAALLRARAFAWGRHVFLGPGERPTDLPLMAHEVAPRRPAAGRRPGRPAVHAATGPGPRARGRPLAAAAVRGRRAPVGGRTGGPRVQRLLDWAKRASPPWRRASARSRRGRRAAAPAPSTRARLRQATRRKSIPGYDLLGFVLGRDPITQEPVERNAVNLIRAVLGLIPGGAAIFDNLQKAGVIQRACDWFVAEIGKLGLTWPAIRALFQRAWDALWRPRLPQPVGGMGEAQGDLRAAARRSSRTSPRRRPQAARVRLRGRAVPRRRAGQQVLAMFRRVPAPLRPHRRGPGQFLGNLVKPPRAGSQRFGATSSATFERDLRLAVRGARGRLALSGRARPRGIVVDRLQVLGLT